jgi:hypothetical protein
VTVEGVEAFPRERLDPASRQAEIQLIFDMLRRDLQSDRIALIGSVETETDAVIAFARGQLHAPDRAITDEPDRVQER